jgi:hypothetical protein
MHRQSGSEAPFVVVSGAIGEELAVEAMKAGAHDYVMKDNLARLCAPVERGLKEAEERRKRRQTEEELRTSEAELRALFEAMTDVILVLNGEGRYLKVAPTNPSLLYKIFSTGSINSSASTGILSTGSMVCSGCTGISTGSLALLVSLDASPPCPS